MWLYVFIFYLDKESKSPRLFAALNMHFYHDNVTYTYTYIDVYILNLCDWWDDEMLTALLFALYASTAIY
jgi:hypothetical protein